MTQSVFVNADKTRVVPEGSLEAAFRLHVRDAAALGLVGDDGEPINPKVKPADKMVRKPANK